MKAGFFAGLSSGFDVGTSAMGGNTLQGFAARTVAMGVVGGTASALGGGKFSNGAMSGAFTHMFNAEAVGSVKLNRERQALLRGAKDGHLTLEEANAWYRNMNGKTLIVDGSKLSYVRSGPTDFRGMYPATIQGTNDYMVHGQVTIKESNGHIYDGYYDFDMHGTPRDIPTIIGHAYAGNGTPFNIHYSYDNSWKNQ